MNSIDQLIEKKIPFVLYNTKEGETVTVFPAEQRLTLNNASVVLRTEEDFYKELEKLKLKYENFQSLRPTKNES